MRRLGDALAEAAAPVNGCTLACCRPRAAGTLTERLARFVEAHGGADDQAEPEQPADGLPWCPRCQGRRWLRREAAPGDPAFGVAMRCPDCPDEVRASERERLARAGGLDREQWVKTFGTFRRRAGTEAALAACRAWAAEPDGWLVLYGVPGCGKTHLGAAVVNALLDALRPVWWWYAADLAAEFRRRLETHESAALLARLKEAPVLVLDDLGSARPTDFVIRDLLEPLIDYRYRRRLPTLVTLIGSPAEVKEHVSESIGRRMEDPSVCRVVAITAGQYGGAS